MYYVYKLYKIVFFNVYNNNKIYKLDKLVAKGCSGKVYINCSENYAIKVFNNKQTVLKKDNIVMSDNFNNQVTITNIVNSILKNSYRNYTIVYDYFKYNFKNYYVFELYDMDLYSFLTQLRKNCFVYEQQIVNFLRINSYNQKYLETLFIKIFEQIVSVLEVLKLYNFVHSDLKTKNILVKFKNKNILYDFKNCKNYIDYYQFLDNLVFRIADLDKASINYLGKRYTNIGTKQIHDYKNINFSGYYDISKTRYSLINYDNLPKNMYFSIIPIRYGIEPFYSSFDIYSLVLSLMFHETFYNFVRYNSKIKLLFYELFDNGCTSVVKSFKKYYDFIKKIKNGKEYNNYINEYNNEFNNIIIKMEELNNMEIYFKKELNVINFYHNK